MIKTPTSFTQEYLNGLKFKELQKLSVQFRVNKRWAKKQELIENLLSLKNKDNSSPENQEEEEQWRDGSIAFNVSQNSNENKGSTRLTFNINTKSNVEDSRLTFEVSQNGTKLLAERCNSRETYDMSSNKIDLGVELLTEARATFEIPPKKKLVDELDSRATFDIPQNGKKLLEESATSVNINLEDKNLKNSKKDSKRNKNKKDDPGCKEENAKIKFDCSIKNKESDRDGKSRPQVKTLTIPYARVTRRTRKDGEPISIDNSPIKISKKSINIKKSTTRLPVTKNTLIKSPAFSSVKKVVSKQTIIQSLSETQPVKTAKSKLPVRLDFNQPKPSEKPDNSDKENTRKILRKRLSKTADEAVMKKPNLVKVNFRTPPSSASQKSRMMFLKKTPMRKDLEGKLKVGTTPGSKSITKPITATKMPDFSKIHKRQFEQMDSLHDYLKKKEERIRKLFGTPQPGQQVLNKSASVFRFQSTTEKLNKGSDALKSVSTPLKPKENTSKTVQKEAFKNKLPPPKLRTDIKDKNRSHIHGVRTNKRFELQMKFRNM